MTNSLQEFSTQQLEAELRRRLKYVGRWYEAYYHSTHGAWAVRLRPKRGDVWIGLFDTRADAISCVDQLDEVLRAAISKSRQE